MGDTVVRALQDVSLRIENGDFVAIMGPSGSGKSTLMHVLGLLDVPDSGSYLINDKEVSTHSEDELASLRRKVIGFIFQQFNLLPRMSALENVALPLVYSEGRADLGRAQALLESVGLGSRLGHHSNEMSGGQQQRVAIARALINRPELILADEPTGNLDSVSERDIMKLLQDLNASGITVVIVTHEEEIATQAKRIVRMRDGVIQSDERLAPRGEFDNPNPPTASPNKIYSILGSLRHFEQGLQSLASNKVRTVLSILGILIGVAAVVAMMALGKGAQKAIEDQLSSLGSNLLVLHPGSARGSGGAVIEGSMATKLSADDVQIIQEKVAYLRDVAANVNGRGQVTYLNRNWNTIVTGVSTSWARMHACVPIVGRFFTEDENRKRSRVAIIGATVVRQIFKGKNPIGELIKINRVSFRVIGVLPEKGASSFGDQDDKIILPLSTSMRRLFGKDSVDNIDMEVVSPDRMPAVEHDTLELMYARHKIPISQRQDALKIMNLADIQAALTASTKIMTLLLSIIATISLLVGGIGIMNIMLVSVTERTREIGLRKAIGAERMNILAQFLIESVVISLVGGISGILLAWMVTVLLAIVAGWVTTITLSSVLLAFSFAVTIGIVFGIYPATKAARLAPIQALRHE